MTKPGMMMVPHLGMVHTIFQGKGQGHSLCIILSYSPHHWTDHDQPDMMMVPDLEMVHTIFQGQGQRLRVPAKRVPKRTAKSRAKRGYLC